MSAGPASAAIFAALFVSYRVYDSSPWVWMGSIAAVTVFLVFGKRWIGVAAEAQTQTIEKGEFHDRVMGIAERMGARLRNIYLVRSSREHGEDTGCVSGGRIAFAEGVLSALSRRELDAVAAYELAHLRARHPA